MKVTICRMLAVSLAGVAAAALAACSSPAPAHPAAPHSPHPKASPVVSTNPAAANEQAFASAMAQSIVSVPVATVAGPVMRAYIRFEGAYSAAWGAAGSPFAAASTARTASGGYRLCAGGECEMLTAFATNAAGRITGFAVSGEPIASRVATAPDATSGGLTITDVTAYRLTRKQVVAVAFKLTDTSYKPVNTSPALLASLGGASNESGQDALPAELAPGDAVYAAALFGVTSPAGLFCLEPNDGLGEHLPCTTLTDVR
jgi:hypothetical protein